MAICNLAIDYAVERRENLPSVLVFYYFYFLFEAYNMTLGEKNARCKSWGYEKRTTPRFTPKVTLFK
jgi:hypothetical protein